MYVCMYVCMSACVCVHMCVCMNVYYSLCMLMFQYEFRTNLQLPLQVVTAATVICGRDRICSN